MDEKDVIVSTNMLTKWFPMKKHLFEKQKFVHALTNVTLQIRRGETLGIVGESGCGKTTLGRSMIRLLDPTSGQMVFEGQDITKMSERDLKPLRKKMQIIFQDPYSSLNPRMMVSDIIGEPIALQHNCTRKERLDRVRELMDLCGLDPLYVSRYPHEFSGGQRQRIGIARALALNPEFLVCDEPVSALDVSIQSQILNLLMDLQEKRNLTYAFISHNLSVVHHVSTQIAVMYLGHVVELADKKELYAHPVHPYTIALLNSIPVIDFSVKRVFKAELSGDIPSPVDPPSGCVFHTRCRFADKCCSEQVPELKEVGSRHFVSCLRFDRIG